LPGTKSGGKNKAEKKENRTRHRSGPALAPYKGSGFGKRASSSNGRVIPKVRKQRRSTYGSENITLDTTVSTKSRMGGHRKRVAEPRLGGEKKKGKRSPVGRPLT